ncbi:MAG: polysaccharide biosynthesis/export family protein [Geminicoccaceae bacterium]
MVAMGVAALLAACAAPSGPPPAMPTPPAPGANTEELVSSYRLGSGDRVKITVFRHEDLSGEFALDGAGNFAMPLIGEVQAYGLTTRELEARLQDKLQDGYLVDPQVSVEVLNYRPFYILGEVKTPGAYPYVNGMTVLNAVALAGGFSYRAKQSDFQLQRGGSNSASTEVQGDAALLPGDIVTVQERFF